MTGSARTIWAFTVGVSAMFSFYWVCVRFLLTPMKKKHGWSEQATSFLSLAVLYLPGLLFLWLMIADLPPIPFSPPGMAWGDCLLVFIAQFFSLALMAAVSALEGRVRGKGMDASAKKQLYQKPYDYLHLLVLVPLMEELLTRGLLGERLAGAGAPTFLFLSALIFSLIHLQTGRLSVPIGMFWNGLLWAWVYWASGSLWMSVLFHGLYNLLATCLPEYLQRRRSEKAMSVYMAVLLLAGTAGAVMVLTQPARFSGGAGPAQWLEAAGEVLSNPGLWLLAAVCAGSYLLNRRGAAPRTSGALPAEEGPPQGR